MPPDSMHSAPAHQVLVSGSVQAPVTTPQRQNQENASHLVLILIPSSNLGDETRTGNTSRLSACFSGVTAIILFLLRLEVLELQ